MDVRQEVTNRIIKAIEAGAPPWRQGWTSGLPCFNASTGKPYQGINQLILGIQPYADPRYVTFKQAQDLGAQVRKGEKGIHVVKLVDVARHRAQAEAGPDDEIVAEDERRAMILKAYTVFNAAQIDGLAPMPERQTDIQPAQAVEAIVFGMMDEAGGRMKLNFGAAHPAYLPRTDEVRMPPKERFHSLDDLHATLLHEVAHATGHPKRLARSQCYDRFGSTQYAREELVAEIASAMVCVEVGLPVSPTMVESHAGYLSSWLAVLRQDKQEIFRAAALAQMAVDYMTDHALDALPSITAQGPQAPLLTVLAARRPGPSF